jgi:mannose-6-phosphate isomerase
MTQLYKLENKIQNYEWGSVDILPAFLGLQNNEKLPWAELWMGTHPLGPSVIKTGDEKKALAEISGNLPFLFKLLAINEPLSIQAHPNLAQAREGFNRENNLMIPVSDPKRNYRDANHKPEIICAITPLTVMAGFREPGQIKSFFGPRIQNLVRSLLEPLEKGNLKDFFHNLFAIDMQLVTQVLADTDIPLALRDLMRTFAAKYPADPAVLSPLYLNMFTLNPGQAIFIPAGILHAYISGFGAELMACSDNVLRGGLTNKHIDINELSAILDFSPYMPQIIGAPAESSFTYPFPCDFSLSVLCSSADSELSGPAIGLVSDGELTAEGQVCKKGESFFICGPVSVQGNFSLFTASCA